jgi:hypothetical protein
MMQSAHTCRFILLAVLALAAGPAHATEGGLGAYLLGTRDSLSGVVPPKGTYVSYDNVYLSGRVAFLAIGGKVMTNAKVESYIGKINLTHSFEEKVLGGRPSLTLTVPFAVSAIAFDGVANGGPSVLPAVRLEDDRTGLSDVTVTAGLGYDRGRSHLALQLPVYLPVGFWQPASVDIPNRSIDVLSTGKNRAAIDPTVGYTFLDPKTGRELSVATGITFPFRNVDTDYVTAPELHVEMAAMQHLPSGLALGAHGYAYSQLGEDSGSGADSFREAVGATSLKARVFAIGPLATYSTKIGGRNVTAKLKYSHEFGARKRLESDVVQFSAAMAF